MKLKIKTINHNKSLQIYDNLFSPEFIDPFCNKTLPMSYGWPSNENKKDDPGHWNHFIHGCGVKDASPLLDFQYTDPFLKSEEFKLWNELKKVFGERKLLRCYYNGYTYGTEGYIHTDSKQLKFEPKFRAETILVFLNNNWESDWAGSTEFYDDQKKEIIYSTLPRTNRIVCFDSSIPHVARSVSRLCGKLRKILAFKSHIPILDESKAIEFVRSKTFNIRHSGTTFFEHLYGTYQILKKANLPTDVCLAGLYHAIYSTTYFKHDLNLDRGLVKSYIGEYAENLAYRFCSLNNRIERIIELNGNTYIDYHLAWIEYANLLEQNPRSVNSGTFIEKLKTILERTYYLPS